MHRLLDLQMKSKSHSIVRLALHLEDRELVYFDENGIEQAVDRHANRDTMLTAWFELNKHDINARQFLYSEIPYHYVFEKNQWKPRKQGGDKILTRIYNCSPKFIETYALRLLLLNRRGYLNFLLIFMIYTST